jgi:hypothetical protein
MLYKFKGSYERPTLNHDGGIEPLCANTMAYDYLGVYTLHGTILHYRAGSVN